MAADASTTTYESLRAELLPSPKALHHLIILNPSHHPLPSSTISSPQFHPTLEAALHILNNDLPSAHFLVRHMQSPPAVEGMLLHGLLHRAEGDFDNSRAWIADVWAADGDGDGNGDGKALMRHVYGDGDARARARDLIDGVEAQRRKGSGGSGKEDNTVVAGLAERVFDEYEKLMGWCVDKFGGGRWADASDAWVRNSEKISKISEDQINGDEGHRKF